MSKFELNKGDNFIFAIDVSGSMQTGDGAGGKSRIEALKEQVIAFAFEASKYDDDGIDVLTFGHAINHYAGINAEKAKEVISGLVANQCSTDTAGVIKAAYKLHKDAGKEQTVVFLATDGEPTDREAVKQAIIDITNEIKDDKEFNISILTVGNIDVKLQEFLTSLDDDLTAAKFDIVDVKKLEEVNFIEAFAGALND